MVAVGIRGRSSMPVAPPTSRADAPLGAALESAPGRAAVCPTIPAPARGPPRPAVDRLVPRLTEPAYPTHRPHRPARTVIVGPGPGSQQGSPATRPTG